MESEPIDLPLVADSEDKSSILCNRIRKNYRHLRKWAKRTGTDCFRIYDRDIKEYPLAVDYYAGRFCLHYYSSLGEDEGPREDLRVELEGALQLLFGATDDQLFWRTRFRRKEVAQYEKAGVEQDYFVVHEYGLRFKVNLVDYLDTGLFLDHRETRHLVAGLSKGKHVLNLFAYTCAFSVHAAAAGALSTTSVDMSNTYTAWGRDNFRLNDLSDASNPIIRADCLRFLEDELITGSVYDVIVIDPPTISRSKKMDQMFDIQQDYVYLIQSALQLLAQGGVILFSTNARRFSFEGELFPGCDIREITSQTIPLDFHDRKIHRCWKLQKV
jgi:23S rRNA G2069 N7-methylase RlmK/C1962 C5-methylase RlmI